MPDGGISVGWIMQPAYFDTPAGQDHRGWETARGLIEVNDHLAGIAVESGFDTVWAEDHMGWGDKAHLECFANLAWLCGRHPGPRYGTVVCGTLFRNPAYLAKLAVNMHLLSGGRFVLGLGAGNNPGEHREFGIPFPSAGERLDHLEEAIRIIRTMWQEIPATYAGTHARIEGATLAPSPQPPIPIMVGGNGERRTLRIVAEHGDWWCADVGDAPTFKRKSEVLRAHCDAVGRDFDAIVRSQVTWVSIDDDPARLVRFPDLHIVAGNVDEVTRELEAFRDAGAGHLQVRFMDYPAADGLERFVTRVLPRLR